MRVAALEVDPNGVRTLGVVIATSNDNIMLC